MNIKNNLKGQMVVLPAPSSSLCRYNNTAEEPMLGTRTIVFVVYDGVANGSSSITITLQSVDDNIPQVLLPFIFLMHAKFS